MKTIVVIGGGPAGFFCAINTARLQPQSRVIILEKGSKLLSKVKVSGGGRCNVTNACDDIPQLVNHYPRGQNFLKKSFYQFNTVDAIKWFEDRGVKLKLETDGKMFPVSNTSQTIINCLLREADKYGVEVWQNSEVKRVKKEDGVFTIWLSEARILKTDIVCVACGGFAQMAKFDFIQRLGHSIEKPLPSLFTFNIPNNPVTSLMGISVENTLVKIVGANLAQGGPLLITHWGLSGPVVLRLSAWGAKELAGRNYEFSILVNWLPNYTDQTLRDEWLYLRNTMSGQRLHTKNPFNLPQRLWEYLLSECNISDAVRWSDISSKQQNALIQHLTMQQFDIKGKTTFKEEFVTCGGVNLLEIDANTMQSRKVEGLYFAGEVMDVDGITGGFNFQHAWTSGMVAAQSIAEL